MRNILLGLMLFLGVSWSKSGTCSEFFVWNPSTKDTLIHFSQVAPHQPKILGECYINTGWTAKVVEWHCRNMYLVQYTTSTFHKEHVGSMSLNPYMYFCKSRY